MIPMPVIPDPVEGAVASPSLADYRMREFLTSCNAPELHYETKISMAVRWVAKVDELRESLKAAGAVVCVCGPRGTGKTQAAVEVMKELWMRYDRPLYRTVLEFTFKLRSTFGSGVSEEVVMAQHISPWLLVLDELQVRNDKEFTNDRLTYIVDARYRAKKRTLLISNLMPRRLAKGDDGCFEDNVGPSIASRIQDFGKVIVFDGPSWRAR